MLYWECLFICVGFITFLKYMQLHEESVFSTITYNCSNKMQQSLCTKDLPIKSHKAILQVAIWVNYIMLLGFGKVMISTLYAKYVIAIWDLNEKGGLIILGIYFEW